MILKIIINLILGLNVFFYAIEEKKYLEKLNAPIILTIICISLALYILSNLNFMKKNKLKILLLNLVYMSIASYEFLPLSILIGPIAVEFMETKEYDNFYVYLITLILFIVQIKIDISYTLISMGIIGSMFIYENMKNERKIKIVEKVNYNLREKIFNLEENKRLENKANYHNIEAIKVEERNIISQKLHDKIGHVIAGSIMQLEALKIIIDNDREKGIIMLDSITNNLRQGMDDIRATLRKIKPENTEIGVNNLKSTLDKFSKEYKIENRITFEGDINEINFVYWKVILDCVKESLTNIIKHSNADLLNIDISVLNKIIRIHIKDNGSKVKNIKKGMGLLGIEERIVNINGNVYFNNEDGFSILIILKR